MWAAFNKKPALAKKYATPIPAGGKRVDVVIPPEGPFDGSMFQNFPPALFQLLAAALGDGGNATAAGGGCCSLQMVRFSVNFPLIIDRLSTDLGLF